MLNVWNWKKITQLSEIEISFLASMVLLKKKIEKSGKRNLSVQAKQKNYTLLL